MTVKVTKYLMPATMYGLAFIAFTTSGWLTWSPLLYAWVLLPLLELYLPTDEKNMTAAQAELAKAAPVYDWVLYFFVLLQFIALGYFLYVMQKPLVHWWETAGRISSMGLLCGTFGINIGHELGHRVNRFEQALAKASLLTSLYMHFFIEHNKGHHKKVATPDDPASARYNEPIYLFFCRSIFYSYLSAWKIANTAIKKHGYPLWHWKNEMIQVHLVQGAFIGCIWLMAGPLVTGYFLAAAFMGILLLETVNYIEHYGLQRRATAAGGFERTMPRHSWNSNHLLGRLMLFELSRHSDHHYMASRKYQLLLHHPEAPQLPTGYPGSMLLAMLPPAWFYVMNRRIKALEEDVTVSSSSQNLQPG